MLKELNNLYRFILCFCILSLAHGGAAAQDVSLKTIIAAQKRYAAQTRNFVAVHQEQGTRSPIVIKDMEAVMKKLTRPEDGKIDRRLNAINNNFKVSPSYGPQQVTVAVSGDKSVEQFTESGRRMPKGPVAYFDGQRLHLLTGVVIENGGAVQRSLRVNDTTVPEKPALALNPIAVCSTIGADPMWRVLDQGDFRIVENRELDKDLVTVKGKYQKSLISLTLSERRDFLPVAATIAGPRGKREITVSNFQERDGILVASSFTTASYARNRNSKNILLGTTDYSLVDCSFKPQETLFAQLAALQIGQVYDQKANRIYELGAPMGNFTSEQGVSFRRVMGWLFIGSLTVLLLTGVTFLVQWKRRNAVS